MLAEFDGKSSGVQVVEVQHDVLQDGFRGYLEGQGDLVSRSIMVITGVIMWVIGVISILTKSP